MPRPSDPAASTIRDVLRELNYALGTIVRAAPRPRLRVELVTCILSSCAFALESLLLAGAGRSFGPADTAMVRRDLALLHDFFLARDAAGVPQGVPQDTVVATTKPVVALLELMDAPSDSLVAEWRRVGGGAAGGSGNGATEGGGGDGDEAGSAGADGAESAAEPAAAPAAEAGGEAGGGEATEGEAAAAAAAADAQYRQRLEQVLGKRTDEAARAWAKQAGGAAGAELSALSAIGRSRETLSRLLGRGGGDSSAR